MQSSCINDRMARRRWISLSLYERDFFATCWKVPRACYNNVKYSSYVICEEQVIKLGQIRVNSVWCHPLWDIAVNNNKLRTDMLSTNWTELQNLNRSRCTESQISRPRYQQNIPSNFIFSKIKHIMGYLFLLEQ